MNRSLVEPPSSETLLSNIITLTEQRDQLSLEVSLFQAFQHIFQPDALISLEWPHNGDSHQVVHESPGACPLPAAVADAARVQSMDIRHLADQDGTGYLLMPIEAMGDDARRVLVLGKKAWSPTELRMVQGMLRVYQNFVRLLNDSEKDTLTGLMNRRRLEKHMHEALSSRQEGRRGNDHQHRDYLAVLDIDHFKTVNDTFGHLIGDEVLLAFANILRRSLRDGDRCYRYGGEDFVILLRDMPRSQVMAILERLRGHVANHVFPQAMHITVSIGFSRIEGQRFPSAVLEEADRALYFAKTHGRDQVREFQALLKAGEIEVPDASGSVELF